MDSLPDDNRGPTVLGVCLTSTLLALLFVIARLYVRLTIIHHVGLDDYVIVLAMALSLAGMGVIIATISGGGGRHAAYLDIDQLSTGLRLNFVLQVIFIWAITTAKISIAFFLMRIAPSRRYRVFLWAVVVCLFLYTTATFSTILLQCQNVSGLWNLSGSSRCWAPKTLLIIAEVHASLNILTDVILASLPIPMLWHVQISFRTKATIFAITGLGVFASIAAIVRAAILPDLGGADDPLWGLCIVNIWNITECNTGIIAASLPTLRPLFKRLLDSSLRYMSRGKSYGLSHDNGASHTHSHHSHGHHMQTFVRAGHSEESILSTTIQPHGNSPDGAASSTAGNIVMTTAVAIETSAATHHAWPAANESDITTPERRIEDRV